MAELTEATEPTTAAETPGEPNTALPPAALREPRMPLPELDRALEPLRRSLAWALRAPATNLPGSKYLGTIAQRDLLVALKLDLPSPVREQLAELGGLLDGFDQLESNLRVERALSLVAGLTRLDAQLGMPLGIKVRRRRSKRPVLFRNKSEKPPKPPRALKPARGRGKGKSAPAELPVDDTDLLLLVEDPQGPTEAEQDPSETSALDTLDRRIQRRIQRLKMGAKSRRKEAGERAEKSSGRYRPSDPSHLGRTLAETGVEPAMASALADSGVETRLDLLTLEPTGEEHLHPIQGAGRDVPTGRTALGGRVHGRLTRLQPGGKATSEVTLAGAERVRVCFDRCLAEWEWLLLTAGSRTVLAGDWDAETSVLSAAERVTDDGSHGVHLCHYGIDGLDDALLRRLIAWTLPELKHVRDPLPAEVVEANKLMPYGEALESLHTLGAAANRARTRLAFEDAFLTVVAHSVAARSSGRERGIAQSLSHTLLTRLCVLADERLDDHQQVAFEAIKRDLRSTLPMSRCLMGNAGAGKAAVGILSMVMVAESKAQVVFACSDQPSAEQRFLFMEPLLREIGLVARLLDGEPSAGHRDAIRRGEVHVVFGTAALLAQNIEFRRLGLVVGEEREHFGRLAGLVKELKQPIPDLLVLNPVPVPGPVLLSAYASQDISVIDSDVERSMVSSVIDASERASAYERAQVAVERGRQVVIIFPTVRGVDALDAREALQVKAALEAEFFQGARVRLFHGSMSREERYQTYLDFRRHRADVLVATAPIEDGPPLPAVQMAIVEQADRTALSRLYRLRGQLIRSRVPDPVDVVYVVGATPDEQGAAWLRRLISAPEPLALFDAWVEERGTEGVLVENAPEPPKSRWLDVRRDRRALLSAHAAARALVASDPGLRRGNHSDLLETLTERSEALIGQEFEQPDGTAGGSRRRRRRRKRR